MCQKYILGFSAINSFPQNLLWFHCIKFVFSENRIEIEFGNSIYWTDFGTGNQNRVYFCNPEIESILENQPGLSKPVIREN